MAQVGTPDADAARRAALERAARDGGSAAPAASTPASRGPLRLIDVSLDLLAAVGTSTARDADLADLKGGAHDAKKRGFTLQQAELGLAGAVDPWFNGKAMLIAQLDPDEGETIVELEEAYLTTTQLPAGLQLKFGTFLTEFGRVNPTHPHAWDWMDQPVVHSRVFGGDGMRGPGGRLSWLVPGPRYSELFLGVQNANGETMTSFLANDEVYEERALAGRAFTERETRSLGDVVWTLRGVTEFELGVGTTLSLGASAVGGPNATGADAETLIYGADFVLRWIPESNQKGYPFWKLQGEVLQRAFEAAEQTDETDPLNPVLVTGATLDDYGGYLQVLHGFTEGWAAGLRVDYATGSGDSYEGAGAFGRDGDPYRTDRLRLSPLLAWHPSEFSRVRLQYDYDDSDHLGDEVHSVWLGFEILIGTHPPHSY
ncbi:MAG: hypothetical protein JNK15_04445 [Planctomycetes bacterium]|nr:hypothetical protein [Planctomycetota bacterium]